MESLIGFGIGLWIAWKLIAKPFFAVVSPKNARRTFPGVYGGKK